MGVTFYIGRTGTGKTRTMREKMVELQKENPSSHKSIIYLVPDQMTFQAELDLISKVKTGLTRVHVLSFSRLAWRTLKETGGITRTQLQKNAINMLIRKVLEEEKDHLRVYKKSADKFGFVEQFEKLLTELKRQDITIDALSNKLAFLDEEETRNHVLFDKLHDIVTVWKQIEHTLDGRYAGIEDYLMVSANKISESSFLEEAEIFVDGFHSFTPQELNVLQALMKKGRHTTIALTLDKPKEEELNPLDLFFQTGQTYNKLTHLCEETECEIEETIMFQAGQNDRKHASIRYLEETFEQRPVVPLESQGAVTIQPAVNRRTEIEAVAREIKSLVREQGYRYKDIAVVSRNMSDYIELIQSSFRDYDIPVFTDQQRPMIHHPVIEFIRSLLETVTERWRYEPLFRTLKTDMLFSIEDDWEEGREEVDILENYILAYGIKEKHWKQEEPWDYNNQRTLVDDEASYVDNSDMKRIINHLRNKFASPILRFEKRLKKQKTVEGFARILFEFLEEQRIPQKIEKMRDEAAENDNVVQVSEHEQVWGAIVELLEQIVEVAGTEKMTLQMFQKVMETGLESMSFKLVPPAIDQVTFADLERSRLANVQVLFLLGVNEGILPATFEEDGILGDDDRDWFEKEGMELAENSSRRLLNEQFLLYRALSLANDKLYIHYPLADEEGKTLQPSLVINQMKEVFPDIKESLLFNEPNEYDERSQLKFIGPFRKTISFLTYQLQLWKKGYPISSVWWDVYNWHAEKGEKASFPIAMSSLFYKNEPVSLQPDTSKRLYGEKLNASVSRIEQFESCAFSQFASYGLRLKERDIYKLEAPDIGQLFHAALKEMTAHLMGHGKNWGSLTSEECASLAKECVSHLAPKIQREILLSSSKYKYLHKKLEDTVIKASEILSKQARVSGFSPAGIELGFGSEAELPPLQFTLPDGTMMEVAGRIDRVDKAEGTNGVYVRVIDYKSSEKNVSLADIYYGLALQMLVYLDVVLTYSESWLGAMTKPAGVLYFHVHNPYIQAKQINEWNMEKELLKRFKMKGLLSADEESVHFMDQQLKTGYSQVVPVARKKDGSFYSSSSVLEADRFDELRNYIRQKLQDTGWEIMKGTTRIEPYKYKQNVPCSFCSFRSVCQFDTSFAANQYRVLHADEKEAEQQIFKGQEKEEDR
ncbi:helicase-exonuclease AddAB subunit AddB [Alteribacillus iranensis]|uniref:ATP-dependent helicase/deoxyribonuclease subunit B n=1 Tax=Alteribacillus iranensis TaxID=930128 RepID=A0A1I1ZZJ5_9BACI|nr:helicase-exonuclease AddAB subunit AddB [Alteribacillus iranensis]SFE35900.1 DNA helicase/exodeoxyribonuclease V, subunit B [Alteribacillus iranensis]